MLAPACHMCVVLWRLSGAEDQDEHCLAIHGLRAEDSVQKNEPCKRTCCQPQFAGPHFDTYPQDQRKFTYSARDLLQMGRPQMPNPLQQWDPQPKVGAMSLRRADLNWFRNVLLVIHTRGGWMIALGPSGNNPPSSFSSLLVLLFWILVLGSMLIRVPGCGSPCSFGFVSKCTKLWFFCLASLSTNPQKTCWCEINRQGMRHGMI